MKVIPASKARQNFFKMMEQVQHGEEIMVTGKNHNMVVVSESDWRSIQETLYLHSIPGMMESIREGMKEPIENCTSIEDLDW